MFKLTKKIAVMLIIFTVSFVVTAKLTNAQMMGQGMMGGQTSAVEGSDEPHESLDVVLAELLVKYNKNTIQELNCNDLTDEEFERVGDAAMESVHPGEAHERMDTMMGGEGSETLRQTHIQMGLRYLGCDTSNPVRNFGMIGGGSMMGSPFGMSAFSPFGGVYSLLGAITWILFIAFLIAGTRWFWKKAGK